MPLRHLLYSLAVLLALSFTLTAGSVPLAADAHAKTHTKSAHTTRHKKKAVRSKSRSHRAHRAAADTNDGRFAALVIDGNTGRVLYAKNADATRYPASLTKMMTLYLTFEALQKGRIRMDTMIPVSAKAASQPPPNIHLSPGDKIPVRTAIEALIVRSANDVAMAMGEALGGTQWDFALMMNKKARDLGMTHTTYHNPSGLPDSRQITTASDLARLALALRRDFPQYYHFFSDTRFTYKGHVYNGHNRLLGRYPGADGIKTGFINASGFNLVTSVKRGDTYLVGVVLGGRTASSRDQEMMNMLDRTFVQLAKEETETKPVPALASLRPASAPERHEEKPAASAATSQRVRALAETRNWSIQVGIFATQSQADTALATAKELTGSVTAQGRPLVKSYRHRNKTYLRARLANLTGTEAREACKTLSDHNRQCLMVRVRN
jgi:D-alanyl-D-alanine carboxypeptidase